MSKQEKKALVPALRFPEFRDKGEWDENTFGGAATFYNGRAYKQAELLDKGKYRVLRVGNFFSNKEWYYSDLELEDTKYCEDGDLLYAWSASFGPRIWKGEKVIYHYHIWKVVEKKGIDKQFLFILLDYETQRMKAQSANGLGLLHITKSAIEGWKCFLPKIEEQQKIADCLTTIDVLITAQTQKLHGLKDHKNGLIQQLFPAEGETLPKLRFPGFTGKWFEANLSQFIKLISGLHLAPNEYDNTASEGKVPYFTGPSDFTNDISEVSKWTIKENNFATSGDTLLTVKGSGVGQIMFLNLEKVAMGRQLMAISSASDLQKFIFYCLDLKKRYFEDLAIGNMIPGLSRPDILTTRMYFPEDIMEGKRIADCLSSADELITTQTQKIDALKAHKKGLMQQLFPAMDDDRIDAKAEAGA